MYFKRLDINGFKSFAEPVSIEFNNGITCVVGPNGSGKSNISDAIRWVLGEQSPKTLRGGKMEDVIFAGTSSRKSKGMAEVTLVVDNTKKILPIDYNEVAITRRMFRSGESEYSINNNPCRLRDIRNLIMDTGIGVDGYSIIGQGKIAELVSSKPDSRREIFEEAAGIVMYRSKKAEAERKLEATAANLERITDIVSELEGRIGGLKEDSEKATEYLALREVYKKLEINIVLKQSQALELKNEYLIDDIAEADVALEELSEKKKALENLESATKSRWEALEKISSDTTEKLLKAVDVVNSASNESELNKEKLVSLDSACQRLKTDIESLSEKLRREEANALSIVNTNKDVEKGLMEARAELQSKIEAYNTQAGRLARVSEDIDGAKEEILVIHRDVGAKESEIKSLEALSSTLERRKNQISREQQGDQADHSQLKEKIQEWENLKASLEVQAAEKKNRRLLKVEELNSLVASEKALALKGEETRLSIGQAASRKKTIEEMEQNYEGYNNAVRFIMSAGISGIEGVVAELIEVPKGFETAIETVLGGALQNIVCADENSAKNGIAHLKQSRAGRLTFLPVTMVKGGSQRNETLRNYAGFQGFAVDCIDFDSRYLGIMESLLGRVVILDNIDNAIAMSKRAGSGLRFVTLEGEIISGSGAITGGAYRNKTANLLERKGEIADLDSSLGSLREVQKNLEGEIEKSRQGISQLTQEVKVLGEEVQDLEIQLRSRDNQISLVRDSLEDIETARIKKDREFKGILEEQAGARAMIDEIRRGIKAILDKRQQLEDRVQSYSLDHSQEKLAMEKASEEITAVKVQVGKWESEMENARTLEARMRASLEEIQGEIKGKNLEIQSLEQERHRILTGNEISPAELEALKEEKLAIERYLEEVSQEKAEVLKEVNSISQKKDILDKEVLTYQDVKYQSQIKKAKNETQLESYKEKLWDEFEISYLQAMEFRASDFNLNAALRESREIKSRIKELGDVNVGAIKEYGEVGERFEFLSEQKADVVSAMDALRKIILEMEETIKVKFKESFDVIVANFEDIFKELFGGGYAELRLEDPSKPLETGIEIVAQPPGKKLQNINLMSGGEKTMTAISLMFAILRARPTPFCILDEVEAALDDANIERFIAYLKKFNEIQFTLVTHQKATMEHADILYGVTMPEQGISKVLSLKLGDQVDFNNLERKS